MTVTAELLTTFLNEQMGLVITELKEDTLLFSSGTLDSFSLVELMMFVESEGGFKIKPTNVRIENLNSVRQIVNFAKTQTGSAIKAAWPM